MNDEVIVLPQRNLELLSCADVFRKDVQQKLKADRKVSLGQFLTPYHVAHHMASMFECQASSIRILDPGAGIGTLFTALIAEICNRDHLPENIDVTAYEIDDVMLEYLEKMLELCQIKCEQRGIVFTGRALKEDFFRSGAELLNGTLFTSISIPQPTFNCVILNPPYKKSMLNQKQSIY